MASTMKETENTLDPDYSSDGFPLLPIESLIHVIRGQQVMLDSDLARLYGVETRRLNEQVKRNIERFPNDFLIQLTKEETQDLMSQIATSRICIVVIIRKRGLYIFNSRQLALNMLRHEF